MDRPTKFVDDRTIQFHAMVISNLLQLWARPQTKWNQTQLPQIHLIEENIGLAISTASTQPGAHKDVRAEGVCNDHAKD